MREEAMKNYAVKNKYTVLTDKFIYSLEKFFDE
jgi:hypothetical protein